MKDLEKRITEADRCMRQGWYKKAAAILNRCRRRFPDDPLVMYNLGVVYYKSGEYRDSIYALEEAVRLGASEPDVYNQLGLSCDGIGDREAAAAYYKKALDIDPDFSMAWNNLGVVFFLEEDYRKALVCFEKALLFDWTNSDTWYNYRDTCRELGLDEEAELADEKYREYLKN